MDIGNNGAGARRIVLDARNGGAGVRDAMVNVRNSYTSVCRELGLGVGS